MYGRRAHLFGAVVGDTMRVNAAGEMVALWWERLAEKYPSVELDTYVVMPNHFHGIIVINRYAASVGAAQRGRPETTIPSESAGAGTPARPYTLSDMMGWFKTMTTNAYIQGVDAHGWASFPGKLWQRNFHDRIIRDERESDTLRGYILTNPARWEQDRFYSEAR